MTRYLVLSCLAGAVLFAGCTDDVDIADNDAASGSGAGGPGASSGSPTGGPSSGGAGSGASGNGGSGAGGEGTSHGGAGGGGGGPVPLPECQVNEDCQLINDCCMCEGLPANQQVEECFANCEQPMCEAKGAAITGAQCIHGVCVAGFDCTTLVDCAQPAPVCPPGQVASRSHGCWGGCVPATECTAVPACANCNGANQVCVQYVAFAVSVHCLPEPAACGGGPVDCACAADSYCINESEVCSDGGGVISCECTNC